MNNFLNGIYRFMTKNGTAVAFLTGVIVVVIGLGTVMGGLEEFNMLADEEKSTTGIFNFFLGAAIALAIVCAFFAVFFGIIHLIMNPKGSVKFVGGFAVIAILVFVFYSSAEVETTGKIGTMITEGQLTAGTSKWISGALSTTLILLGLTFLTFIGSEIRNVFK